MAAGFDAHLPKPVDPKLLITTVFELVKSKPSNGSSRA
jgi:CheY-like chemotaxis protein